MDVTGILLSLALGVGLSAACGFRIFVPFAVMSLAARAGLLDLSGSFEWLASTPALIGLLTATALEVTGYFIPWVDHALDVVATPAAIVAGAVAMASVLVDVSPVLRWGLAVIAGGGAAGAVQASTVALRAGSTATSGGIANPLFAGMETTSSLVLSILTVALPMLAVFAILILAISLGKRWFRRHVLHHEHGQGHAFRERHGH